MKSSVRKFLAGLFGVATLGGAAPVPQALAPVMEKQVAIDQVKPERKRGPEQRRDNDGDGRRTYRRSSGTRTYQPLSLQRAIRRGHAVVAWTTKENGHGYQDLGVFIGRSKALAATFRHGFGRNPEHSENWEPSTSNPANRK